MRMWSFAASCRHLQSCGIYMIIIVMIMVPLQTNVSSECPECSGTDKDALMMACQTRGNNLQDSEKTGNATIVCAALHEMFLCVGVSYPQCLDLMYEQHASYTLTPWDCHSTPEQVHKYQELSENGCMDKVTMETVGKTGNDSQRSTGNQPTNTASSDLITKRSILDKTWLLILLYIREVLVT